MNRIWKNAGKWIACAAFVAVTLFISGQEKAMAASDQRVDMKTLRENIDKDRSGLPEDLEEKPLKARSLNKGVIPVYTDSDLMEMCGQADGATLEITATDATKYALFCDYDSADGSGTGWIEMKNFISDPDYDKKYGTIREDMPVFYKSNYKDGEKTIPKYSGIIVVSAPGKKHQVLYDSGDYYALGWMKNKNLENTLEYDGRPKKILMDGMYVLHNINFNDGKKTYEADPYPKTLTFIHLRDDKYYIITGKGAWLGMDTMNNSKEQHVTVNNTERPLADGLFKVTRHKKGYEITNDLTGYYLGMNKNGKLTLYDERKGKQTVWRISARQKMVEKIKPMVFTQYDPAWCGAPYGTDDITGCIGHAGCGLLAPVNAVYALTGQYMDVMELCDFAVEKNYRVVGSGTADSIFKGIAKTYGEQYGFAWDGSSDKISVLVKKLQAGDTAVSHVEGHYVAIVSCSPDGKKFLLLDSNRLPKRETTAFGDWVSVKRLESGTLSSTGYFFYKQFDGKHVVEKDKKKDNKKEKKEEKEATTQEKKDSE